MRIAVVIPAREEAERVARAVASARAPEVEVIVVDAGSEDATRERARAAGARVIVAEAGRARQLAAGAAATEAEAIVFLHADSTLPAGWDGSVRAALADPAVAGGAFGFRFDARGLALRAVEWGVRLRLALARLPYGDQAIFARRSALAAIGGVPQTPILEDVDLVRALRRRGRFAMIASPVVTSARRYRERGVLRTVVRNALVLLADALGVPRERIAAWARR